MSDDDQYEGGSLDEQTVAGGVLAEMQAEILRLNDEKLRSAAEMDNMRKRLERQIGDERQYGISKFARDILSVADNLRRAIDSSSAARNDPAAGAILTGIELTEKELLSALERNGIRRIEALGQKFDPNFHQAIAEVPGSGKPHGTVVDVVQPGYMIGDRLLRAAMVAVAKGEPARPATPPGSTFDGTV